MGWEIEDYNKMYDDLCKDDDLNYTDPSTEDFLASAKKSAATTTALARKTIKLGTEISDDVNKA